MEFQMSPIFVYFNLLLVVTHAALPPELYWKSMLPSTPMPKAITELLNRGHMGEPEFDDQQAHIVKWGQNDVKELEFMPFFNTYAKHALKELELSSYGKAEHPLKEPENPFFYFHSYAKHALKELELSSYAKAEHPLKEPQNPFFDFHSYAKHALKELELSSYGKAEHPLKELEFPFSLFNDAKHALKKTQNQPKEDFGIFFEEDIHPGKKLNMHFSKSKYVAPLLPRQIFESMPFSKDKMEELLNKLSVKPNSENAEMIKKAITYCEEPPADGEEKKCPASLESMVDFVISKFGKNAQAISTELENDIKLQKVSIKEGVKKFEEDKAIVCHRLSVPYVAFLCHKITNTSTYFVPLEAEDGARVKAIAICHKDTLKWNADLLAFQVLNVKPGTTSVCHFTYENTVVWLPK